MALYYNIENQIHSMNISPLRTDRFYSTCVLEDESRNRSIVIPSGDFFIRNKESLERMKVTVELPIAMAHNPKMVSKIIYGTTELWMGLLRANEMTSFLEFDKDEIYIYHPDSLRELLKIDSLRR